MQCNSPRSGYQKIFQNDLHILQTSFYYLTNVSNILQTFKEHRRAFQKLSNFLQVHLSRKNACSIYIIFLLRNEHIFPAKTLKAFKNQTRCGMQTFRH